MNRARLLNCSPRRFISNISGQVHDLPKISGTGPFPSYPAFKSLGPLVSVSLPSSSALYTREGSILAINSATSSSPLPALSSSLQLSLISKAFPFVYTKLVSAEPSTILLTSAASPSSSPSHDSATQTIVVTPTSEFDWIVPNRAAILAWSSFSSNASTADPTAPFVADKYSSIRIKGASPNPTSPANPQIVLAARTASGPVLEFSLLENETVYVHPNSVLAYTEPSTTKKISESFVIIPHSESQEPSQETDSAQKLFGVLPVPVQVYAYFNSLKALVRKYLYQGDDILLKITGPKTLLVASGGNSFASALEPPAPTKKRLQELLQENLEKETETLAEVKP